MCVVETEIIKVFFLFILGTARAGRTGTSITLLEHKEVFFFKKMLEKLNQATNENEVEDNKKKFLREIKVPKLKLKPLVDDYKLALEKLKTELNGNNNNKRKRKGSDKIYFDRNKNKKIKLIENKE